MTVPRVARERVYYGWVVLGVAALRHGRHVAGAHAGSRAHHRAASSRPRIESRHVRADESGRDAVGALFCLGVGRLIDRLGSRVVLTVTAVALGLTVLAMSQASTLVGVLVLVTLTRGFGQSALSVISLAMVGKWFRRRLTMAMAIYALVMSIGFMAAFPLVGAVVQSAGWRIAWASIGARAPRRARTAGVVAGSIVARNDRSEPRWRLLRRRVGGRRGEALTRGSATLGEALRSPAFWVFALASSVYGLVASGIGLLNESILAERGFAPDIYYTALAVTAITGLGRQLRGRRARSTRLAASDPDRRDGGAGGRARGARPCVHASAGDGAGGRDGDRRRIHHRGVLQFLGHAYGQLHLGRIQGAAQAMTVVASAIGPLFLAVWVERTGSYAAAFYVLAGIVAVLGVAAAWCRFPPVQNSSVAIASTSLRDVLLEQIDTNTAPTIIDVRTAKEFSRGHVPGALNIPFESIAARALE